MNMLSYEIAAYEVDRRLRDADHYRRVRWGRTPLKESSWRARRNGEKRA